MPSCYCNHRTLVAVFSICLITTIHRVSGDQKFAIEAENVTAVLGSTVVMPCRVVQKQGVLQWTKDDFGLGSDRNLSAFDRYTMTGSDADGDYSLRIEAITLDDDARYQCQVSPGPEGGFDTYFIWSLRRRSKIERRLGIGCVKLHPILIFSNSTGQPGIRSRFVQLNVITPAEAPRITQGDFLLVTENNEFEIECVSIGGKPAADVSAFLCEYTPNVLSFI